MPVKRTGRRPAPSRPEKRSPTQTAINATGRKPGDTYIVKNCTLQGVVFEKSTIDLLRELVGAHRSAIEALHTSAEGLTQVTGLLNAGNIRIESLLQVGPKPDGTNNDEPFGDMEVDPPPYFGDK